MQISVLFVLFWRKIKQNKEIGNARNGMNVVLGTVGREGFRDKMNFEQRTEENEGTITCRF